MNKWLQILIGVVFLAVGVSVWVINCAGFGTAALDILKGGIMWIVLLTGLLLVVLGINSL